MSGVMVRRKADSESDSDEDCVLCPRLGARRPVRRDESESEDEEEEVTKPRRSKRIAKKRVVEKVLQARAKADAKVALVMARGWRDSMIEEAKQRCRDKVGMNPSKRSKYIMARDQSIVDIKAEFVRRSDECRV